MRTPIDGVWVIETASRADARGRLTRVFCRDAYRPIRSGLAFVQVNHTVTSHRGTVRGLHWQRPPQAEAKLIRCLRGAVYDVAVDLRRGSPTFGRWHAVELSADNGRQVFIPEGCAHGFQSLSDDTELLYQHTASHAPEFEAGLRYDDPSLAITWPLPVTLVSGRDLAHPPLQRIDEVTA